MISITNSAGMQSLTKLIGPEKSAFSPPPISPSNREDDQAKANKGSPGQDLGPIEVNQPEVSANNPIDTISQSLVNKIEKEDGKQEPKVSDSVLESQEKLTKEAQERLEKLAEEVNTRLNDGLFLRFRTDKDTGIDYFQLIEKQSGDVVRQYPPEEMIDLAKTLQEAASLLLSEEA